MLIKNVQIKNLFSFEEVNIELESNIYLVTGINLDENGFESNGTGKTSLLNSIYWCLFNKVIDKRDSSEVLRLGADKGSCVIAFDNNIKLIRRINSKGIKKLTVIQNNTDISADTATDTQTIIDEMLDCNKDSFLLSNFMSSDFSKAFIGKDTSPKDRFETFDKLIDSVTINNCLNFCTEKTTEVKRNITALEGKLEGYHNSLGDFNIEQAKKDIITLGFDKEGIEKQVKDEQTKLDEIAASLKQKEVVEKNLSNIKKRDELVKEMKTIEVVEIDHYERISEINNKLTELNNKLSGQDSLECPNCNETLELSGGKLIPKKVLTEEHIQTLMKEKDNLLEERTTLKAQQEHNDKQVQKLNSIKANINALNSVITDCNNVDTMYTQGDKEEAQQTLKELRDKLDEVKSESTTTQTKINNYNDIQTLIKKDEATLSAHQRDLSIFDFWKTGFNSIKASRINTIIPAFEYETNNILSEYFDFSSTVKFNTTKSLKKGGEKIELHVTITDGNGQERTFESMSMGEQSRLAISVTLARNIIFGNKNKANFLMIDELLDGLDKEGQSRFVETLKKITGQVFIISHSDIFKDVFTNKITFIKENGVTRYDS